MPEKRPEKHALPAAPGDPIIHKSAITTDMNPLCHSYSVSYPRFDGGYSKQIEFKVMKSENAVGALVYHSASDTFVFVQQFRPAALPLFEKDHPARHAELLWPLEIVAGSLDPSMDPETMIRKEVEEETGCVVEKLELTQCYFVNPVQSTMQVHLFIAEVSQFPDSEFFGNEDEGENIRVVRIPSSSAIRMAKEGRIKNSLTLIAILDFALRKTL